MKKKTMSKKKVVTNNKSYKNESHIRIVKDEWVADDIHCIIHFNELMCKYCLLLREYNEVEYVKKGVRDESNPSNIFVKQSSDYSVLTDIVSKVL
jgi:hypothetical protein